MTQEAILHDEVVRVAEEYLGPAAPRFINRLITNHLDKAPMELTQQDLPQLATWAAMTVALFTDDVSVVEEFTQRLNGLSDESPAYTSSR